jgi:hypothetical protein
MWYQASYWEPEKRLPKCGIAYAESRDGVHWETPLVGLHEWHGSKENNIVYLGCEEAFGAGIPALITDIPPEQRRGYRYLMMYKTYGIGTDRGGGVRLVGSQDGIHWDQAGDTRIAPVNIDHQNMVLYDPPTDMYFMYCRAKDRYHAHEPGININSGASRRAAVWRSKELWTNWLRHGRPQNIFIPDEIDNREHLNFCYIMPVNRHAGIYWGLIHMFRSNTIIFPHLATSRDGLRFARLPSRPPFLELGKDGCWDDSMILASPLWVDKGNEWWIYYSGWDGPHGSRERNAAIGLATMPKERFVSLHGPRDGGGVVVTRLMRWPGGNLVVNADASMGVMRVRVSDVDRKPLPGFDYHDCLDFTGDSVAKKIQWENQSMTQLVEEEIRFEFFLENAHLYAFRAAKSSN